MLNKLLHVVDIITCNLALNVITFLVNNEIKSTKCKSEEKLQNFID